MADMIESFRVDAHEQSEGSEPAGQSRLGAEQRYALIRSLKSQGGAEDFVRSISQQLLLQNDSNWGDLLGAAPAALCCLGQCFVAATASSSISSLELPMQNSLQTNTLRANLVRCSDLGRKAFTDAQSKMQRVSMITDSICQPHGTIDKILRSIDNEKLAKVDLQRQLDKLKTFSEDCTRDAEAVHAKFTSWLDYAADIRLACVSAEDNLHLKTTQVNDDIKIVQARKENQSGQIEQLAKQVDNLELHVKVNQEAYSKASQALPTGWNLLAQQFAGDFAGHAITLLSTIGNLRNIISDSLYLPREPAGEENLYSKVQSSPSEDLGYTVAAKISKHLGNLLASLSFGEPVPPQYGVDWNTLYGFSSPMPSAIHGSGESIDVILGIFQETFNEARPSSYKMKDHVTSSSSREALDILNIAIEIAEEIRASKGAEKSLKSSGSPRDPGKIKRWRSTLKELCNRLKILEEDRNIAVKQYYEQMDMIKDQPSKRQKKPAKKWEKFDFARENLKATHEALLKSEDLLAAKVRRDEEARQRFDEMQVELTRLTNEDMSMKDMIGVLKKCIERLSEFQSHLEKLIQFFDGLNNFIDVVHKAHAKEFLAQVNNIIEIDAANEHETEEIRRKDKQYLADELLMDALQLRGHYLVAGELASVYVDVSRKHIMPGVDQIDRLATNGEGSSRTVARAKARAIQDYARKAQAEINDKAAKRQAALRKELFDQERDFEEIGYMIEAQGSEISEPDWISEEDLVPQTIRGLKPE